MNISLFPKNTQKLLEHLLRNPVERFNVNQLARDAGMSVGSAHRIAKALEQRRILAAERVANSILYTLNLRERESRSVAELVLMERRERILRKAGAARLYGRELLQCPGAEAIVLFGSILTRGESAGDVDALIIVRNKADAAGASGFCTGLSKTRAKPVVPLVMTPADLAAKLRQRDAVVLDIMRAGVVLSGESAIVEAVAHTQRQLFKAGAVLSGVPLSGKSIVQRMSSQGV